MRWRPASFFAVRSHLRSEIYILNVALGSRVHGKLTSADQDILLKLVGYRMGGLMVDKLLDYFADPPNCPADLTHLDDQALEKLRGKLELKAMLLSLTVPVNDAQAVHLPAIRKLLAQAGDIGKEAMENGYSSLPVFLAALDFREFLPDVGVVTSDAATEAA